MKMDAISHHKKQFYFLHYFKLWKVLKTKGSMRKNTLLVLIDWSVNKS